MSNQLDLASAEFVVELKPASGRCLKLSWPKDCYYDLIRSPVTIVQMDAVKLVALARESQPTFPDAARVAALKVWFAEASEGVRVVWPSVPVLSASGGELAFIEGRHRCAALSELGAVRIPVIVG